MVRMRTLRGSSHMTEKRVPYYCPSCRQTIMRTVTIARRKRRSYCSRTGRDVWMRLRKAPLP